MSFDPNRDCLRSLLAAPAKTAEPLGAAPLVLYGAGGKGRATLRLLREAGHRVAALVDRQATGTVDGLPILALDDPAVAAHACEGCAAIVTIFNPGADPLPVHHALEEIGFSRVVGIVELRQLVSIPDTFWLSTADTMTPGADDAGWLWEKLADETSRKTLLEAIALRRTFAPGSLRTPTTHDQYFPAGVPLPRAGVRLIDGGAYDGDTIGQLLPAGFRLEAIAAFEPDPANFAALTRRMAALAPCTELSLWPCGLDETPRQLSFQADGLASSGITAGGGMTIQTVTIDVSLPYFRPSYVKLDIEGAEQAALQGMAATLRSARPALAVCVYHRPADLWEIPRRVDALLPDSRFYLRSHAWNRFDLVLYAVPHEMTGP